MGFVKILWKFRGTWGDGVSINTKWNCTKSQFENCCKIPTFNVSLKSNSSKMTVFWGQVIDGRERIQQKTYPIKDWASTASNCFYRWRVARCFSWGLSDVCREIALLQKSWKVLQLEEQSTYKYAYKAAVCKLFLTPQLHSRTRNLEKRKEKRLFWIGGIVRALEWNAEAAGALAKLADRNFLQIPARRFFGVCQVKALFWS